VYPVASQREDGSVIVESLQKCNREANISSRAKAHACFVAFAARLWVRSFETLAASAFAAGEGCDVSKRQENETLSLLVALGWNHGCNARYCLQNHVTSRSNCFVYLPRTADKRRQH
jgi:hypothetical protein